MRNLFVVALWVLGLALSGAQAAPQEDEALKEKVAQLEAKIRELEARLEAGVTPRTSPAAEAPAAQLVQSESALPEGFKWSGLVDLYYGYNFNRPDGEKNLIRAFDTEARGFGLNYAELVLQRPADPWGFRLDLGLGPTAEVVHSAEPGGSSIFRHLQQAYGSYRVPAGRGLTVDFGKFVTQHGAEVIETADNWNYSRSLLFTWAIPFYHFGARANYPLGENWFVNAYLVNGWNNVVDNNRGKTFGLQVGGKLFDKLSIVQNYMVGPERAEADSPNRHMIDSTITLFAHPRVSLMANYDYGLDGGTHWQGVAGYARLGLTNKVAFIPRVEWYDDHDGFTTGTAQQLKEVTLTGEWRIHDNFLSRLEYRRDWSDVDLFEKRHGRLVDAQTTVLGGVVFLF